MGNVQVKNFNGVDVRYVVSGSVVWFVAKDIVEGVGSDASNIAKAIQHVPEEWSCRYPIQTAFGVKDMGCLSEEGVNFYLFRSDKPFALPFQKWIAGEVLPSLQKHGGYTVGQEEMTEDQLLAKAVLVATSKIEEMRGVIRQHEEKINILSFANADKEQRLVLAQPKIDFHDAVEKAENLVSFKDYAAMLRYAETGKTVGRNKLLEKLRELGLLTKDNKPYQQFSKYFEVVTYVVGNTVRQTTKVTGDGITYLTKKLVKNGFVTV